MHRIPELVAGVRGCENGHVEIYQRGTGTRATWYPDFEGSSSNSSGDDIPLDEYGREVVYVDELVDVRCYDADDTLVVQFGAGSASSGIELVSDSFTGTNYSGGGAAVSRPTTVEAAFDKWDDSAGAPDWQVLFGGVATNLSTIVSALQLGWVNAQDETHGATGEGVADDYAALQSAIDEAAGNNHVVFIPPGVYRCGEPLELYQGLTVIAYGATFRLDDAAKPLIQTSGSAADGETLVLGLRVTTAQSTTEALIEHAATGGKLTFHGCKFVPAHGTGLIIDVDSGAVGTLVLDACHFAPFSGSSLGVLSQASAGILRVRNCDIVHPASAARNLFLLGIGAAGTFDFQGNHFDVSGCASGTGVSFVANSASGDVVFMGNTFTVVGGGTPGAVSWQGGFVPANGLDSNSDTLELMELMNQLNGLTITLF